MVRIEKFLHEATYPCVGITYRPKTENWFLKSPPWSEHILWHNMLNLIWVHFLWKIIPQVLEIIIWVWSGQALSQLYPSLVNTKENLFGVQPPSFFIFEFALNANLLFGYLVPTLQRFHFDHQKSNFSLKSKYLDIEQNFDFPKSQKHLIE